MSEPYYADDYVTLYHGDALDVLSSLPEDSIDAVLTDPPYSSGGMFRGDRQQSADSKYGGFSMGENGWRSTKSGRGFAGDSRDQRGFLHWASLWMAEAFRCAKAGSTVQVFTDWRQLPTMTDAVQCGGWTWRGLLVWDKGVGRPMKGRPRNHVEYVVWGSAGAMLPDENPVYLSSVLRVPPPKAAERVHLTQKPVDLCSMLLRLARPGGVVCDPFIGSGTTLVAARQAGMRAVGIEADEQWCEVAANRLRQEVLGLTA